MEEPAESYILALPETRCPACLELDHVVVELRRDHDPTITCLSCGHSSEPPVD